MLLEKLVQVFDKSATWLLLTKRLPIMSVLENIIAVSSWSRTYSYIIVWNLKTIQRSILLIEFELGGHWGQVNSAWP